MDIREEEIRAFEDFQRHSRQESREQQHEARRTQLRESVLAFAFKPTSSYRRTVDTVTGEKNIHPVFSMADHAFLQGLGVSA